MSLYFMCCPVNGSVCLVCLVLKPGKDFSPQSQNQARTPLPNPKTRQGFLSQSQNQANTPLPNPKTRQGLLSPNPKTRQGLLSPNPNTRQGLFSQHFLEALLLSTVSNLPFSDQHGFQPGNSTNSALLQLTSDIATGFNQRKPPHLTVCVCVDLTAAFDTVNHNVLLSKIVRSTLPEATCRWLSNYLRGRQSVTSCRDIKSRAMIVHTGVPQGYKMSPTLFSFYLADMARPTKPVKRICYADDITVWASGVKIPELEHNINGYLTEMFCFLRDNSLLISAQKCQTQCRPIPTRRSRSLTQSFPLFAIQSY